MMRRMSFDLSRDGRVTRREIGVADLVIAGWTGRDPHKVQEHIEELAALGVAPPPSTPCFYRAGVETLTQAEAVDCLGADSSGEAEFVILVDEAGAWWVGVGSDHTDRKVESYSITVSKQMCPKPVSTLFWAFEEVAPHWDQLQLRSWVEEDGQVVPYQEGSVAAMRDPRDTAAQYERQFGPLTPGTLMLGGTLPAIGGIRPRQAFSMMLHDPVRSRSIEHRYTARWLPG